MTNREWLSTLSDDDFIIWLFRNDVIVGLTKNKTIYEQPSPRLQWFKYAYTDTKRALKDWLKQERKKEWRQ